MFISKIDENTPNLLKNCYKREYVRMRETFNLMKVRQVKL